MTVTTLQSGIETNLVKTDSFDFGPSHLFTPYSDEVTGKRDLM